MSSPTHVAAWDSLPSAAPRPALTARSLVVGWRRRQPTRGRAPLERRMARAKLQAKAMTLSAAARSHGGRSPCRCRSGCSFLTTILTTIVSSCGVVRRRPPWFGMPPDLHRGTAANPGGHAAPVWGPGGRVFARSCTPRVRGRGALARWRVGQAASAWCHDGGQSEAFRVVREGPSITTQVSELQRRTLVDLSEQPPAALALWPTTGGRWFRDCRTRRADRRLSSVRRPRGRSALRPAGVRGTGR